MKVTLRPRKHEPTEVIEQISVTELGSFRECRRRWFLAHVRNLVGKTERKELWFGDLMHGALQVYAVKGLKKAQKEFVKLYDESMPKVKESYGGLWEGVEEMYADFKILGLGMLENYERFCEASGMELENVHLEQRVWVPIRDLSGKPITGTKLTARMDRVVGIKGKHDLYILDYKTGSSASTGKSFELNDQVTGYADIYWRLTSELPFGIIFEHLLKKIPEDPRILKNGSLSTAKNQNTMPWQYEAKMKEMGLMKSKEHLECLYALEAQGFDGYFEREMTQRNVEQVLAFEKHLYFIYQDMLAVVADPRKAYPNPSSFRCPRCPFLSVCMAMDDGSDYEHLIETQYVVDPIKRW